MAKTRSKIVIDTDCGVDDAVAIMLALSAKDVCEVMGITCCFGNCALDDVCKNVMRVLTLCRETKIPIYRGSSTAFIRHDRTGKIHGSDGLGNRGHEFSTGDLKESEIPAVSALIKMAKEHPKEITLIAIGPLTNLAIAQRIDPHFTENLKSIVIMGGNYKGVGNATDTAEFNFYCDPIAANIVLTEPACSVVLVPWETVLEHGMDLIQKKVKNENITLQGDILVFLRRKCRGLFIFIGIGNGVHRDQQCIDVIAVAFVMNTYFGAVVAIALAMQACD
ncbi:uncharacterized protein LOC129230524 [Uloborus diversus]|uniref:uncharacterized protein LOC129230524 n=1 Tax=Uloborus diversus TaxID=327109 RepID=UPI0024091FB6|nr:uncharacterized protein LOC129230524 [Uloborus diversus]